MYALEEGIKKSAAAFSNQNFSPLTCKLPLQDLWNIFSHKQTV